MTSADAGPRRRSKWRTYVPAALLFLAALGIWELWVVARDVPTYLLPRVSEIGTELDEYGWSLFGHLRWTMLEAVLGFLAGSAAAFLAAVIFVHMRAVEGALFPWAIVLQTIPIVAIAPLLTIWFGFTLVPKVVIAAIICFFPVLVNRARGLRSISPQALELMNVLSARKTSVFWRLRVPSSLPYVFSGLRIASTLAVIGAIVAEFTGSDRGIGFVIIQASYRLDTKRLFAGLVLSSAGGIVFFNLIGLLERLTVRWPGARLPES